MKRKKLKIFLIINLILVLLSFVVSIYAIQKILLLKGIENILRYILIITLLVINIFFIIKIFKDLSKKKKQKRSFLFAMMLILFIGFNFLVGYSIDYIYGKIANINKEEIIYSTSLITLSSNKNINSLKDLNNKKIGMISNSDSTEGYVIANNMIKENNLDKTNEIISYDDFTSMMISLYEKEIDAIFVSSGYVTSFSNMEEFSNIASETKVISTKEELLENKDNYSTGASVNEPFTMLLMGVDSPIDGMNKNAAFNGDSLMLVTFNPKTLNTTIMSIPRDSYVPIACYKNQKESKITHAASYGANCMIKTIENFTGITIDYYAKVNFKALVKLVDALGGVNVDVEYSFCEQNSNRQWGKNTIYVKKGYQTLNGEQALAYARNRHTWPQYCSKEWNQGTRSDFIRAEHQQAIISALLTKIKDINLEQFNNLFNTISNNIDTNMTNDEIIAFYNIAKDIVTKNFQGNDEIISFQKLTLQTTEQRIYDESLKMVLSNQIISFDSLEQVIKAMKVNLELEEAEEITSFSFSMKEPYEEQSIGYSSKNRYNLYDLMPNLIGKTKTEADTWAKKYNIKINYTEKEFTGNTYTDGKIISQDTPVSKRLDKITNKTINLTIAKKIVKEETPSTSITATKIDCSKEENENNKSCIVPDFTKLTKKEANDWANKLKGVLLTFKEEENSKYEEGTIIKQSIEKNTHIKDKKSITITITKEKESKK